VQALRSYPAEGAEKGKAMTKEQLDELERLEKEATTGPVVFGREMRQLSGEQWLLDTELMALHVVRAVQPARASLPWRWSIDRKANQYSMLEFGDSATAEEAAYAIEKRLRLLVTCLVPLLDDSEKREVVKALGFHVCDSCNDMRAGTWEEARDVGWVHGTFGPGPDGATLCAECHAGQGSE
jgi:hypothetical protein